MSRPDPCGRIVEDGAGLHHVCERPLGHRGAHRSVWKDRDGVRRIGLEWTHERGGFAVTADAADGIDVTRPK